MGVCIDERPVMHWQQSARFLGSAASEKSETPPAAQEENNSQCQSVAGANNKLYPRRTCSSYHEICDHSTKQHPTIYNEPIKSFETTERETFDESLIKYAICKKRMNCLEVNDDTNISLKSEPYGPPSSPESTCETKLSRNLNECAGCGCIIKDRFYLSAVEKRWHVSCLQCFACRQPLDRESTCYSRDGNIYCKTDYFSFFGTRRCSRCLASISSTELVMRARNLVFHVNCFFCSICHVPLTKGDQFGILDSLVYCRTHYTIAVETESTSSRLGCVYTYAAQFSTTQEDSSYLQSDSNRIVPSGVFVPNSPVISGLQQPPRQKGRPRKRKPKEIDALTSSIDLNTEYLDFGRGSHLNTSSRTKRMRTSFKHHQLRTMKSYFAINHNPDAKDLKQLSQKTGLPKRVLQVWFQNARAKWRRMMIKQDGSSIIGKSDGSLDLDSISVHSPSSFIMGTSNNSPQQSMD